VWGGLRLGFANRCLTQNRTLTQRSKDAKGTGNGRKGLQFERGAVRTWGGPPGPRSRAQRGVFARTIARTAGRETHTTLGPTPR